jgi:SLT domain-containing protein
MTDVLSPFYSSDPRRTRLGFRAFATGGIAMSETYARIAENEPEVVAPLSQLPSILAKLGKSPANNNERPINVVVNAAQGMSRDEARATGFQVAQAIRRRLG